MIFEIHVKRRKKFVKVSFQNALYLFILGEPNAILLSDTDCDDEFAGFKKEGRKIVFSGDDDDNFYTPKSLPSQGSYNLYCPN